jgi:hypothetical protein
MKGRVGNLIIAAALLLFTASFLLLGEYHWGYESSVIMFPWMAGTLVIICAVWLLVRSYLVSVTVLTGEQESIGESDDPRSSLGKRLAWMASVYPLSYVFGIIAGLLIFTVAYTSYHRLPWWQRVVATVVVFVFIYIGFYKMLGVALPVTPLWMRD